MSSVRPAGPPRSATGRSGASSPTRSRYAAGRRESDLAPSTVNRELAFLKRGFNVAMTSGLADTNPVKPVRLFIPMRPS